MYVELITILVRAKDDITRACRRCQSTLYIVFNIAKVGGPHYREVLSRGRPLRGGSLSAEEPVELRRVDAHWSSATTVIGRCLPLQKVVKGSSGRLQVRTRQNYIPNWRICLDLA